MTKIKTTINKLMFARSISFFGSSFSDFVLPLFIYEMTKSPILIGLQWTVIALSKIIAGKISGRFHIGKTNKHALLILDLCQAISTLIPLVFWNYNPALGTFISGFLIAFCITLQAGYIESTVVHLSDSTEDANNTRTWINANLDKGKNIGLFLGYLVAWLTATYAGYKVAIAIDSLSFLVSALVTYTVHDDSIHELKNKVKASYSYLFQTKTISYLTISQALLSFSIFIFNAGFIYTMKHEFNSPNGAIAALLIFQSLLYIVGSSLASKFNLKNLDHHVYFRFLYVLIFLGFSISTNYYHFILFNALLSLLISFTQPRIISIFQSFSNPTNSRSMGSARASLMAVSGSIGSVLCGYLLSIYSFKVPFLFATLSAFICSVLFLLMTKSLNLNKHLTTEENTNVF